MRANIITTCRACLIASALCAAAPATAQEAQGSGVAAIAAQPAETNALEVREPNRGERMLKWAKDAFVDDPNGFYPAFGSVYSGGGFTVGAGYRRFYGSQTHWDVRFLQSIRNYRLVELTTDSWHHAGGRLDLHARLGWRDAPGTAFHGLGIDSPEAEVGFGLTQRYVGGGFTFRPARHVNLRGGVTYEDYSIGLDRGGGRPAIGTTFTAATAPLLGTNPSYVHAVASAGYDWRPSPGYARSGGLYELRLHDYSATSGGADRFSRLEAEVVQHVPLGEKYVLSLHGLAESTLQDGARVPFYLMPSLGGSDTLRGYSSWRFRDRQMALGTVELRWIPNRNVVDIALFYDAGMVAPRWSDMRLDRVKSDIGIGVRFHGPRATPVRIELATGREGMRVVFAGSAAF